WHLFLCRDYSGEIKGSGETEPEWVDLDEIHKLKNLLPNTIEAPKKAKEYLKNNTKISLIVAVDQNRGIGKSGKMPWYIPADFKRFKEITMGHPVIMGRKTFESIPGPLPGRTNIVISRNHFEQKDSIAANSLEQAIEKAKNAPGSDEIFVIGGGQIFQEAINIADKIYLTLIKQSFDVDTYFPDYSDFKKVVFKQDGESNGFKFTFLELEKGL
ncbi:dihydrofolate reductase, partial [Patescibacteria group bacterium]|nr:dihydrofolate reductase [Patescibacteria group bacterium]